MSVGNWLYYRRKYKLIVLKRFNSKSGNKKILALTYERNWKLPAGYSVKYFDITSPFTVISMPGLIIEREYNDSKAEYEFLYKHGLKKTPKAFWFIDAHVADTKRVSYCDNFDFVFVAQSPYLDYVKKNTSCKNIFWLPLCFPGNDAEVTKNPLPIKYPLSFIGRSGKGYEKRNEMISFLQQEYNDNFFTATDYNNARVLIQQSKVTTNYSLKDDLNFRVFETLGYGTQLVTNHVPDLDKIEGLKEKLHYFRNNEELKSKIDELLSGSECYVNDMAAVQTWIKEHHTMKQRLAQMLEMINTGKQVEYK